MQKEILNIEALKTIDKKDLENFILKSQNTELLFHLSIQRTNALSVIDFLNNDNVLLISTPCEIISSFISSKVNQLTILEDDKNTKELTNYISDSSNFNFISNLNDINPNTKFDKILIIDNVLFKNSSFTKWLELLTNCKNLLNENGEIYLMLNNKYSIKYFSGIKEEFSDEFFSTLEKNILLSNVEIRNIAKELDLNPYFYYPLPDFYFANEIFSEKYLPSENNFANISQTYKSERYVLFNDELALKEALNSNKFETFAPSFIVRMR